MSQTRVSDLAPVKNVMNFFVGCFIPRTLPYDNDSDVFVYVFVCPCLSCGVGYVPVLWRAFRACHVA